MKVLLDHNIARHLAPLLPGHEVKTAQQLHWNEFRNGRLLRSGEEFGFDVMITGDKGIYYQQNLNARQIAIILVTRTKRRLLEKVIPEILAALSRVERGSFQVIVVPDAPRPDRSRS